MSGASVKSHLLYALSVLYQGRLVLDFVSGRPCLDLVARSLQLLDFPLEVVLKLVLLRCILGGVDLLVDAIELFDAFVDLLEGLVDFLLRLSRRHVGAWEVVVIERAKEYG